MFSIICRKNFQAAHATITQAGELEATHTHNWKIECKIVGTSLDSKGYVVDYCEIDDLLSAIIDPLSEKDLNNHDFFKNVSPTTENIAKFFFGKLSEHKFPNGIRIHEVAIFEDENHGASYHE